VLHEGRGVTLSFATEFIDAVYKGELVEGTGEIVRAGRSIIFMRGMLTAEGRPVLSFSGTMKRVTAPRTAGSRRLIRSPCRRGPPMLRAP
jgi:acyl-coenzyme A thioesterase PaaI-like protein